MESALARKLEDKAAPQRTKETLQKILTAMNDYIREHSDTVKSPASDRLLSIKKIASSIYGYYKQSNVTGDLDLKLLNDFDSNLSDFFGFQEEALQHKRVADTKHLKLLPELKDFYKADGLPRALHGYHAIITLIQGEIKKMPGWMGRSELRDKLVSAIAGYDIVEQQLGTHVYLVIYSDELTFTEMTRNPIDYANYLYEALTSSRIYYDGQVAATFNGANKSYHVAFCASKEEAVQLVNKDHKGAGCFGAEFSFSLRKISSEDTGQYVPLLSTVGLMDIWENTAIHKLSNQFALECHANKAEFVITRQQPLTSLRR